MTLIALWDWAYLHDYAHRNDFDGRQFCRTAIKKNLSQAQGQFLAELIIQTQRKERLNLPTLTFSRSWENSLKRTFEYRHPEARTGAPVENPDFEARDNTTPIDCYLRDIGDNLAEICTHASRARKGELNCHLDGLLFRTLNSREQRIKFLRSWENGVEIVYALGPSNTSYSFNPCLSDQEMVTVYSTPRKRTGGSPYWKGFEKVAEGRRKAAERQDQAGSAGSAAGAEEATAD